MNVFGHCPIQPNKHILMVYAQLNDGSNWYYEDDVTAQHTDREKDGYTGGWYDKTAFRIDFTMNGQPDNYEGRQDFGDGDGSLIQHILSYHEYYAKDENWKNFVLHNKDPEAWEQDKAY